MKPARVKILFFFTLVLIELVIWYRAVLFIDFDFGFHKAAGSYILERGIPKADPFSYTMPSFPYIDHEWLTDVAITKLYDLVGMEGLAVVATLLILLALLIPLSQTIKPYSFILLLLSSGALISVSGVRPQVITWLFVAVILKIGDSDRLWKRYRFLIPILMIIWVNLHGGFAAGVMILSVISTIQTFKHPQQWLANFSSLILIALATFINPYGPRIWDEIFSTLSDNYLRATVGEWQPIFVNFSLLSRLSLVVYFGLSFVLVSRYFFRLRFIESSLYIIWLVLALVSRRHIPIWLIVSLPAIYHSFELLSEESWFNRGKGRFLKVSHIAWAVLLLTSLSIFIYQGNRVIRGTYTLMEDFIYPVHAIEFLKKVDTQGNIFSSYSWGGYLIWKLPGKKVFIDGRMPSWRWNSPSPNESNRALQEYDIAASGYTSFDAIFEKYQINTVLWPTNYFQRGLGSEGGISSKIFSGNIPYDSFLARLIKRGWVRIYGDPVALIYVKPKN